jgi:hypothetical protein
MRKSLSKEHPSGNAKDDFTRNLGWELYENMTFMEAHIRQRVENVFSCILVPKPNFSKSCYF